MQMKQKEEITNRAAYIPYDKYTPRLNSQQPIPCEVISCFEKVFWLFIPYSFLPLDGFNRLLETNLASYLTILDLENHPLALPS